MNWTVPEDAVKAALGQACEDPDFQRRQLEDLKAQLTDLEKKLA